MTSSNDYKKEYKTVLQFLMIQRMTPYSALEAVLDKASEGTNRDLDKAIEVINEKISCFLQQISTAVCEVTGEKMVVLLSTADREELKTYLNSMQVEYFYQLLHAMITTNGFVSSIDALNIANRFKINLGEAERILELFVHRKLIMTTNNGFYTLTPLSMVEFGPFISEHYDVESCSICQKIVIIGVTCPNRVCRTTIHQHCFDKYKSSFKKQAKCPKCKTMWIEQIRQPIEANSSESDD